ncbi:MAG: sporulation protein YtfJ [Clostridia bacterium]|nr:sporulation protein YtfJ [Clostridia bacterium]
MEKENHNKIDDLVVNAMKNLTTLANVDSIIGTPITTAEGVIIPVSKITMGFLTGGGEYGEVKYFKKDENYPFSGGSGAVVSMKPMGFLIDNGNGFRLVAAESDVYDKLFTACENFINSIKKDD